MAPRMRSLAGTLLAAPVLTLALAISASAQTDIAQMSGAGRDIRRFDLGGGVYQFMTMRDSYVRQLNSIAIVNDHDVMVFDTNTRPSSARIILAQIRQITDKPVRFIVNSHGHPDHWSGNEVYARAFPSLEIVATRTSADIMRAMAGVWLPRFTTELQNRRAAAAAEARAGHRPDGTIPTPNDLRQEARELHDYATFVDETRALHRIFPTLTFDDHMTFFHGGREFRFMSVTGDQDGTTVLYLPAESIVFTGDAVAFPLPYVGPHPSQQIASLRMLADLNAQTIVPGHGPAFHDTEYLHLELQLFEEIVSAVAAARGSGAQTVEEVQQTVTADNLRERFTHGDPDLEDRFRLRVSDIVSAAYSEIVAK